MNHIGIYTGMNYTKPARKLTMRPMMDMTRYATGIEGRQPTQGMGQLPPAPIDPAYEAFMRGENTGGTYEPDTGLLTDESTYQAERMDMGLPLR